MLHSIATAIGLDDDINRINPVEMTGVALLPPVGGAWYADRGNPVKPKGVAIRFSFDQSHLSLLPRLGQAVEAVEARLGP